MGNTTYTSLQEEQLLHLGQAIFYNCSGMYNKIPVSIVRPTAIENETIWFTIEALPITESTGNVFAAELFFYKKGEGYCAHVEGIAEICRRDTLFVKFTIQKVTCNMYATALKKKRRKEIAVLPKAFWGMQFLRHQWRMGVKA